MRGLFFCLVKVTVKTAFPMKMETYLRRTLSCLKWTDTCLYFDILVELDSKDEVKSQAKSNCLETSHDKTERELVDGRVVHEE